MCLACVLLGAVVHAAAPADALAEASRQRFTRTMVFLHTHASYDGAQLIYLRLSL